MDNLKNIALIKELEDYYKDWISELNMTNKSIHTINSYNHTIITFIEFIGQYDREINFSNIKKTNIIQFLEYRNNILEKQQDISINTKKLIITHLKIFFRYIEQNSDKLYDFRNLLDIKIKIPKKEPKSLTKSDQNKLLNTLELMKLEDDYTTIRNILIIKLLFFMGLRRDEVKNININDFKQETDNGVEVGYSLKVTGKGSKERLLYIKNDVIEYEIEAYKEVSINDMLCCTKTGKLMDGSQIYRMVKSFYKRANINDKDYNVHSLRHTFATNLLIKGVDISVVQVLLGHSDIKTTTIYTQLRQEAIKNIIYNI